MSNFLVAIYNFTGPIHIKNGPLSVGEIKSSDPTDFFKEGPDSSQSPSDTSGGHWLLAVLGNKGRIEEEQIWEVYSELFSGRILNTAIKHIGPFETQDEIEMLMIALCEKLNIERSSLCSVAEYNTVVEELTALDINNPNAPQFAQILFQKTREIKLPENAKNKGIFGKIFH